MNPATDAFTSEVERSRRVYDQYDAAGRHETVWTAGGTGLRFSDAAAAANAPLDPAPLFAGCPMTALRVGQRPTLGESIRVPNVARKVARAVLDRLPIVNYPATHCAALIGPKN